MMRDEKLAEGLHAWHGGGHSALYAVGSKLNAGRESTQEMYELALNELRSIRYDEVHIGEWQEVGRLIDALTFRKQRALIKFDLSHLRQFVGEGICHTGFAVAEKWGDEVISVRNAAHRALETMDFETLVYVAHIVSFRDDLCLKIVRLAAPFFDSAEHRAIIEGLTWETLGDVYDYFEDTAYLPFIDALEACINVSENQDEEIEQVAYSISQFTGLEEEIIELAVRAYEDEVLRIRALEEEVAS